MDKNCMTCKWYHQERCNNNELLVKSSTSDDINYYIENGILHETIRETINLTRLANDFLATIEAKGYLKKITKQKTFNELYEEDEVELYENLSDIFSSILYKEFKEEYMTEYIPQDPYSFYCCKWE